MTIRPGKTTTIRFNDDEQKIIDAYMEFQEKTFSTIVKKSLMDDQSDFFDSVLSENAIEYNKVNNIKYTST